MATGVCLPSETFEEIFKADFVSTEESGLKSKFRTNMSIKLSQDTTKNAKLSQDAKTKANKEAAKIINHLNNLLLSLMTAPLNLFKVVYEGIKPTDSESLQASEVPETKQQESNKYISEVIQRTAAEACEAFNSDGIN